MLISEGIIQQSIFNETQPKELDSNIDLDDVILKLKFIFRNGSVGF